ncbi:MAG TPA: sugar ABC transporter substrate-binding protein [Methylomirabilota bacterium]
MVVAFALTAGCGPSASADTVLRFWAMGREGEVVTALLPEFERANPGIRVKVQQLPWTAAHEKLLTAFAGDATPDVCQLGNTWIPELTALNALEPLETYARSSAVVRADDYFAGIWDTNRIDDSLYGVPWYVDTRLLFYRRDRLARVGFSAPPVSWTQWKRVLAALAEEGGRDRYAMLLPLNEVEPLLALALQQDDPLLRDGGRWGNFTSAGFRRALGFYLEIFQRGWAPMLATAAVANVWTEFGRGRFAFYISGPWNIGELKRRLPREQQDTWMTAPLPGPDGPGASIAGGSSLVVFHASRHKAAAWRLIEFLSQPSVQQRFHALTGDLPPRRATWQYPALANDVHARAFREQLERVKPVPKVPEWERIATEIRLVAERAAHGEVSVDEAARVLDARTARILEKRRWLLARKAA